MAFEAPNINARRMRASSLLSGLEQLLAVVLTQVLLICFSCCSDSLAQSVPAEDQTLGELQWLGRDYLRQGKYKESAEAFSKLLKLYPTEIRYYISLADAHTYGGRYAEAVSDINTLIKLDPKYDSMDLAVLRRARANRLMGRYRTAIKDCDWIMRMRPDPFAYLDRAESYCALNQHKKALEDFDQALKYCNVKIDGVDIMLGRAKCNEKFGLRKAAVADFKRAGALARQTGHTIRAAECEKHAARLESLPNSYQDTGR